MIKYIHMYMQYIYIYTHIHIYMDWRQRMYESALAAGSSDQVHPSIHGYLVYQKTHPPRTLP